MSENITAGRRAFSKDPPTHQTALDIFKGSWFSKMPEDESLVAGAADHFADGRVPWAASHIGGLRNKRILELGPFEGYNSYQFDRAGAGEVVSIDNSLENYLKCLTVKNIYGTKTTFLHGDFLKYEAPRKRHFDVVWASGILYHLSSPLKFFDKASEWGDAIFIWTQYYDSSVLTPEHAFVHNFYPEHDKVVSYYGKDILLHYHSYITTEGAAIFAGGDEDHSYWMELDDIYHALAVNGFTRIEMGFNNAQHVAGPACFFMAFRD